MPEFGPNNFRFKGQAKLKIEIAFEIALDEVAEMIKSDLRRLISVPVEGSGRNAVRSKPGEPPRKETGKLHKMFRSVNNRLGVGKDKVLISVWNTDVKAKWLEKGTRRMAKRPFLAPVRADWARNGKLKRVVRTKMAERLK